MHIFAGLSYQTNKRHPFARINQPTNFGTKCAHREKLFHNHPWKKVGWLKKAGNSINKQYWRRNVSQYQAYEFESHIRHIHNLRYVKIDMRMLPLPPELRISSTDVLNRNVQCHAVNHICTLIFFLLAGPTCSSFFDCDIYARGSLISLPLHYSWPRRNGGNR